MLVSIFIYFPYNNFKNMGKGIELRGDEIRTVVVLVGTEMF